MHKLRVFRSVGSTLSFRKAGEELCIAQPAVSRAVKALEDELGLTLVERTTRRVALTPAGDILLRHVEDAFLKIQHGTRLAKQAASGEAGNLLIGYSALATYGPMAELVLQYNRHKPDVITELRGLTSIEQIEAVKKGAIDCGLVLTVACREPDSHFVLFREQMVALVSRHDELANRPEISLMEITHKPFVFGPMRRWATFRSVVDSVCLQSGFLPNVKEEPDDVPVLLRCIQLRKGISLYGASIRESLPPDIMAIPITDAHASFEISLVWDPTNESPLTREFVKFARHVFQNAQTGGTVEPA
ncbi:LysR family transcriptional regulator [Sinorhizobium meliloti]|uniref:LysR family transcriptional regulator n=1 Tax=Rhizobium meliloti TaxID=382 RepID=UPI00398C9EBA